MQKVMLCLLAMLLHTGLFAQSPRVPSRMTIGDIKLKITDGARAEIQKNVDDLTRHPKYFNAKVDLANQYFPFIEEAFKSEGVPEDIKYLVIQESGLISDAVSSSNAVGYWQFKDFTAVEMGLRVDRHVDERKNILSASIGAAKYMNKNNDYFDNWIYAIQAYQMGAGGALKVTDEKLYGSKQMTINKKTYWYVKKYLAHKVAYESAVGKSNPSVYLSVYKSGAGMSIRDVAKKMNVDEAELVKYNKWLAKGKVPADKVYALIIPNKQLMKITDEVPSTSKKVFVQKAPSYNQSQAKLFPKIKPWRGSDKYAGSTKNVNKLPAIFATKGSSLEDLAKKGNLSLGDFLAINEIEIDHMVVVGEVYYFKKKKPKAKVYYHVVQYEETLWSISQKYGVRMSKVLMKNRMGNDTVLKTGRVLWMRHIRPENIAIAYEKSEDTQPISIELETGNEIEQVDTVQTEKLTIDTLATVVQGDSLLFEQPIDSARLKRVSHIVEKGDTYYNIANRYEVGVLDLVKWNKLTLADKLAIDQELDVWISTIELLEKEEPIDVIVKISDYHLVEKGETMYSISRKYGLTLEALKSLNNKNENTVAIGERLRVSSND
jgi:membrane-bound lytic murein transglycosylase D